MKLVYYAPVRTVTIALWEIFAPMGNVIVRVVPVISILKHRRVAKIVSKKIVLPDKGVHLLNRNV